MRASDLPTSWLGEPTADGASPAPAELLYAALSATNEAILRATTPDDLYQRVCAAATGSGLIMIAAVLLPDDGPGGFLRVAASSGPTQLPSMRISVDATRPEGRGMAGTAFQTHQACVSADLRTDPRTAPWRAAQASSGVRSGAAVPLVRNGASQGVLLFYSPLPGAFDEATVRLLERMVENVGYALEGFEREAERSRLSEELQRFRAAIDLSGDTVYLTDVETMRFIDVNETACRRLGYTRAELMTMGPAHLTNKSQAEIRGLYDRVIACAPDAIVTEQIGAGRDGRTWFSEVSRRALKSGDRWLIVTISRDIDERRRHEQLQALQHAVTHALSQTGSQHAVLAGVLAGLGPALNLQRLWCTIEAGESHDAPQRLATWQHADSRPCVDSTDRAALAQALHAQPGQVVPFNTDGLLGYVVPLRADGKTLGALALQGDVLPTLQQIEPVLVAIGDQLGQFIRRKQAEQVLARSEARFRSLTELSSDWYWECDPSHQFTSFGGRNVRDVGAQDWRSAFFGRAVWELPNLVHDSADWSTHRTLLDRRERFIDFQFAVRTADGALRWTSASGEPFFDTEGQFIGYHGVSRDITERRLAEDSIRHLATHDTLTGLPNRALFLEELGRSMRDARREGATAASRCCSSTSTASRSSTTRSATMPAICCCRQMATRLRDCLRASDLGGATGRRRVRGAGAATGRAPRSGRCVARKLLAAVTQPMSLKGQECRVTASIGISHLPRRRAATRAALMKNADIAMYHAKRRGPQQLPVLLHRCADTQSLAAPALESSLRRALERNEFVAALPAQGRPRDQRATSPASKRCCAGTSRARLGAAGRLHPAGRRDRPDRCRIGGWVLHQACAQQHGLAARRACRRCRVAVNLSARQFADADLLADIQRVLARDRHDARRARTRDHRKRGDAQRRSAHWRRLQRDQAHGRAAGDRRFRHRLLVARLTSSASRSTR